MGMKERMVDWLSGGEHQRRVDALREATDAMLARAIEDATWTRVGAADQAAYALPPRDEMVQQARFAFDVDTYIKRGVWTHTEFAVGQGIDLRPKRRPGEEPVQGFEVIASFWNDRHNQEAALSPSRQQEISNSLLVDGEVFYSLHVDSARRVQVRRYPTLNVTNIIQHPDDSGRVLYYVATITERSFDPLQGRYIPDGRTIIRYYRAIGNDDPASDPLADTIPQDMIEPDAVMMHVSRNRIRGCGFGISDVWSAIRWARAAKKVAEDQATVSRATAALMTILTAQGSDSTLEGIQRAVASVTGSSTPSVPTAGSMSILPEGNTLSVNRAGTQASDAFQNSRLMRMPMAAAFGIPLHFLADPENANLATSTSMELPTLKHLITYQGQVLDAYRDMCDYVLRVNGLTPDEVPYTVSGPDIIQTDNLPQVTALANATTAEALTPDQISQKYLEVLQFNDTTEELDAIIEWRNARTNSATAAVEQPASPAAVDQNMTNGGDPNGIAR